MISPGEMSPKASDGEGSSSDKVVDSLLPCTIPPTFMTDMFCQCCGMPMTDAGLFGTGADGFADPDYCMYCLKDGVFSTSTLEEQIECNLRFVDELNRNSGKQYTVEEARAMYEDYLPRLKRWRD